jgi:ABC-type transport system involved in cytochrome c biogenesis permease subunit
MLNTLAVAFVAVCVPWIIRFELLSAFVLIPLACLSVFLAADLIVDSFITYPHGVSRKEFTGRVFACVTLGWALGLTILTIALAGLNAQNWTGELLLPDTATLIDAGVLSLAASVLVAAIAVRVTWKASTAGPAKLTLKLVLMLATVISIYACTRWQTDGSFVITSQTIHWVSWFFAVALFGAGLTLLILPARLRQ